MPNSRKRSMTPEDFHLLRAVSDPQVSPDGGRVAYVETWCDKESDEHHSSVFVVRVDGRGKPERFTSGKHDHSPRWSPNGRFLAFISARNADKNQLFVAPLDGGEPRQLTKAKHGVAQPSWSADGKWIAYAARVGVFNEPNERKGAEKNAPRIIRHLRYRFDGIGYFDARRMHIFTIDVETGKEAQVTSGDWDDQQPAWSPDGRWIAFISDRERDRFDRFSRADVWVAPPAGGRARRLTRARGGASQPQFSPDGRTIAFVGHEHGEAGFERNMHLMIVPAEGGRAPRSISAPLDRSVVGHPVPLSGRTFAWSRDGRSVLFLAADRGSVSLYRSGVANGSVSRVLAGDRQITAFALTPDGRRAAFSSEWVADWPEVYVASFDGSRPRMLSGANKELRDKVALSTSRRVTYKAKDGLEIEAFALFPPGYGRGRSYPLALQIHGGPHAYHPGSIPGAFAQYQSLAAAGYVVLLPNPRGSQSYGERFAHAVVQDWGGKDYDDIMAAVDLMVRRRIADPDRLYIGGGSYGGFMSSWAVGHTDRFRAAIVAAPVADEVSMFGTTDIPGFSIYEIGGTPYDSADVFRERSVTTYLPNVRTPVLLLHWEGDLRCPISQSEEIFQGLKILGKPVEFVRYPGGFHTVRTPSQEVDRIRRGIAWYDGHGARRAPRRRAAGRVPVSRNGRGPAKTSRRTVPALRGRQRAPVGA